MAEDCSQNTDPLKLVREGTSQDDRISAALDPASAPVNAHTVSDNIVFAQDYARLLKRYDANNAVAGDWENYFGSDLAVPLAVAAIEDVDVYKTTVREWFNFLNNMDNAALPTALKDRLGYLYAAIGTLAQALDGLKQSLPDTVPLKGTLQNLISTQLAPAFKSLIGYYNGGVALGVVNAVAPFPAMRILRRTADTFADVLTTGLSADWSGGNAWAGYVGGIAADTSVYDSGGAPNPFVRINHCSTHNLFTSVFDQFLKVYMRAVSEAQAALTDKLNKYPGHAPHYALYLAFLQLLEYARTAGNTLTQEHLDFYYRTILGLKARPAQPGYVHLLAELAKQAASYDFAPGLLFKAGKDANGKDAFFANVVDFVANKATVAALKTVYRHGNEPVTSGAQDQGRIFASPVANSDDGQGAPLTSTDQSWQPFFNKVYADGKLSKIKMPEAQIGFAIASHYLLAAEGARTIIAILNGSSGLTTAACDDFKDDVKCLLTTAKGWLEKPPTLFGADDQCDALQLVVELDGADDAIVPYSPKVHGYNFDTDLPVLLVTLLQDDSRPYAYPRLQDVKIAQIDLIIDVTGMKTHAASNDFGPVDLSKPFQPFGSSPVAGSSLVIGSKEIFQKTLTQTEIDLKWQIAPTVYPPPPTGGIPTASVDFLKAGAWNTSNFTPISIAPNSGNPADTTAFALDATFSGAALDTPDFSPNEAFSTSSRQGFVRLRLNGDIGQDAYQTALLAYLSSPKDHTSPGSKPPQGPVAAALTMSYTANSILVLNTALPSQFGSRPGQFFHLAPFGTAEQHPYLTGGDAVTLLPQFSFVRDNATLISEAEFYIGVAGLAPQQSLSLLFQVSDGTANPLAPKPVPHIDWCYLAANQWVEFPENAVTDSTDGLLNSGIITFAVPNEATSESTFFPAGMYWIRAAVSQASDAVCRLQLVAGQAMKAVFSDQGNAPDFSATPLPPGTVAKLATPDSAVKSITQPYPSFGGRGAEQPQDFYRRVSERLRHKDRAVDLWDYEHLILQAFPQIYKVKCLNHTCYEPADSSGGQGPCTGGIYRELAPGHVTIVTLPNLKSQQELDPLKPYTSLGLLQDIQNFLGQRTGSFVTLHVMNPQFEEVRVCFKLKLYDGYDAAYYTGQLRQAITRFLSPWAFTDIGVPSFGGKIYKSVLVNFVEEQPYVDYVTDFQLFQDIPCQPPGTDMDEVMGSRAVSILVSAPAGKHHISIIESVPDQTLVETCGCEA